MIVSQNTLVLDKLMTFLFASFTVFIAYWSKHYLQVAHMDFDGTMTSVMETTETIIANNVTESSTLPFFWEYKASLDVQAVVGVFIVTIGIFGNILVIAVLATKGYINSTSLYLINLAVSDLTVCV